MSDKRRTFGNTSGSSARKREEELRRKQVAARHAAKEAEDVRAHEALREEERGEIVKKERRSEWKKMESDRAEEVKEMKKRKQAEIDAIEAEKEKRSSKRKAFAKYMEAFSAGSKRKMEIERRKTEAVRTEKELTSRAEHEGTMQRLWVEQEGRDEKLRIQKEKREAVAECDHIEAAEIDRIRDESRTQRSKTDRDYHRKKLRIEQDLSHSLHLLARQGNPLVSRREEVLLKKKASQALSRLEKEMHQKKRKLSVEEGKKITELKRVQRRARQKAGLEEREALTDLRLAVRRKKRELRKATGKKKEDAIKKADRIRRGEEDGALI